MARQGLGAEETASEFHQHEWEYKEVDVVLVECIFLFKRAHRSLFDLAIWELRRGRVPNRPCCVAVGLKRASEFRSEAERVEISIVARALLSRVVEATLFTRAANDPHRRTHGKAR